MNSLIRTLRAGCVAGAAALACALAAPAVTFAADDGRAAFRVCRDPNNLPFANAKGEGYEDKIAQLLADDIGLPLTVYEYPARFNFVRNTLKFKLPGEEFRCDLIVGVPAGFDQVNATRPYYRSTYALVIPAAGNLAGVKSVEEFLALPASKLAALKIGIIDKSPASAWLVNHGLLETGVPYQLLVADPEKNSGQIVEDDLVAGKIDAAIIWGPIAGFYSRRHPEAKLTVLPLKSEKNVKFEFDIAMGVRYGEKDWKSTIEGLLDRNQSKIEGVLAEFGVPLVPLPPPVSN